MIVLATVLLINVLVKLHLNRLSAILKALEGSSDFQTYRQSRKTLLCSRKQDNYTTAAVLYFAYYVESMESCQSFNSVGHREPGKHLQCDRCLQFVCMQ